MKLLTLLISALMGTLLLATRPVFATPEILLTRTGLTADDLALIINDEDPLSRQIGDYYQQARHIPLVNVIHIRFTPAGHALDLDAFAKLKSEIDQATPAHVQAYAIAWTNPYRVGCMSITSALAFGYDEKYCSNTCRPTQPSLYFNSPILYPYKELKFRPAMMLAGTSFEQVKNLIDRGVAADQTFPSGRAYLLSTNDKARNVRSAYFEHTAKTLDGVFPIVILNTDSISFRQDVLFYFTGLSTVPRLQTLNFLPGALADHLTSFGGQLSDSSQMSSLRWLEAGATASYGTVVEPCNYAQKFPFPSVAMFYYGIGASAIEAYWKSVAWPGEGVFVGEPLSRPFAPKLHEFAPGQFELQIFAVRDAQLSVESSATGVGPYRPFAQQPIHRGYNVLQFVVSTKANGFVRLQW